MKIILFAMAFFSFGCINGECMPVIQTSGHINARVVTRVRVKKDIDLGDRVLYALEMAIWEYDKTRFNSSVYTSGNLRIFAPVNEHDTAVVFVGGESVTRFIANDKLKKITDIVWKKVQAEIGESEKTIYKKAMDDLQPNFSEKK
jgi:hypothetical protein